ncbi:hypothetical protein L7F22_058656 [Adiantum nelumboides]|nr:hypothetical protein [Adiantum nelumboides]
MLFSVTRFGPFHHLKQQLVRSSISSAPSPRNRATEVPHVPSLKRLQAALLAGALGTTAANSAICLQSHGRLITVFKRALHENRLCMATTPRTMLVAGVQLAAYDEAKQALELQQPRLQAFPTCIAAGAASGIVTTVVSRPIDNIIHDAQQGGNKRAGAAPCGGGGGGTLSEAAKVGG